MTDRPAIRAIEGIPSRPSSLEGTKSFFTPSRRSGGEGESRLRRRYGVRSRRGRQRGRTCRRHRYKVSV